MTIFAPQNARLPNSGYLTNFAHSKGVRPSPTGMERACRQVFTSELQRQRNSLIRSRNGIGKGFLFVEADLALTFCETIVLSTNRTMALATLKKTEQAFNAIWKARPQLVFSAKELRKFDALLARLHEALTECAGLLLLQDHGKNREELNR